ncbi:MAG TPA: CusA/CzcA family heavy metal efflux RND transporter, partial [Candidatus Methylacidiphilales bacterium]
LDDLRRAVVRSDGPGRTLVLGDLGAVGYGAAPREGLADLDGKGEAVGGIVVMRSGADALRVIAGVKEALAALAPSLPPGVKAVTVYDRSKLIGRAVATLRDKLVEESLVVSAVCLLFLWRFRSGLVAILVLPLAVLLSFVPFHRLGMTANILSLGGIAIALGAMVDAALVMVENAHKRAERLPAGADRAPAILAAAKEVGRPLFFSLLVITVSFLPIFALPEQSGRLFAPLATTKTWAMAFAAFLSVTLVPVLMVWLLGGKGPLPPEERNPLNRLLTRLYAPVANGVLRRPRTVVAVAALLLGATAFPLSRLGSEFMPPLDEGDLLFMPTAVPGLAADEAARILRRQDAILKGFPEVETVFGKAGRADTATDPAPLSMSETTIQLKPRAAWRPGMTREKLVAEMDRATRTPGMANIFWMPVQTRTEMLATGFRSKLGLKVHGPDLDAIDRAAAEIARVLGTVPGTRSVFAERAEGGRYLDVEPDREALARYGITAAALNDALGAALGSDPVAVVPEGRERVAVRVAYAPGFRDTLPALGEILVPAQGTAQIPLKAVAKLSFRGGPPEVRSEGGRLVGFVSVDPEGDDTPAYVRAASARLAREAALPEGVSLEWTGTYRQFELASARLRVVVPVTLLVIFILIYANTRSVARTGIVLLAVPFSLIGAFWFLWALGYHLSVAVWVGLIALAGIDAETGVVMLLYLDQAREARAAVGTLRSEADLLAAIREGAVRRLRPKTMTVCAILFGLLPILWGDGTGSDVMKRVAAPMVGGVVSSALLELLVYPAVYLLWQRRRL